MRLLVTIAGLNFVFVALTLFVLTSRLQPSCPTQSEAIRTIPNIAPARQNTIQEPLLKKEEPVVTPAPPQPTPAPAPAVVASEKPDDRLCWCPVPRKPKKFRGGEFPRSEVVLGFQEELIKKMKTSAVVFGANEGYTATDPAILHLQKNKGIQKLFVEPIPPIVEVLKGNLIKQNFENYQVLNAAVGANDNENVTMYCYNAPLASKSHMANMAPVDAEPGLKTLSVPSWFSQLCSFDIKRLYDKKIDTRPQVEKLVRNHQLKDFDTIKKYIRTHIVPSFTAPTILKDFSRGKYEDIAYLQIDAEGFDYHIVKQLPFATEPTFRPCMVLWEGQQLNRAQNDELIDFIRPYGYFADWDELNVVMIRHNGHVESVPGKDVNPPMGWQRAQ